MGDEGEKQVEIWKVKRVRRCCFVHFVVQLLSMFMVDVY